MADAISIQELIDARTDAKTLEEAVNGDAVTTVLSRLGETYPTLSNALNQIDSKLDSADTQIKQGITSLFENGGLPATPFATKALMTASALVDGKYAMVTDDTVNNGLYVKTAGAWVKSGYDPVLQANAYADEKVKGALTTTDDKIQDFSDTFLEQSANMLSLTGLDANKTINATTGAIETNSSYSLHPFIAIEPSTQYTLSADNIYSVRWMAYYNKNKEFLGRADTALGEGNVLVITTPSNAYYARPVVTTSQFNSTKKPMLVKGSTKIPYEPKTDPSLINVRLDSALPVKKIEAIAGGEIYKFSDTFLKSTDNLLRFTNLTKNKTINQITGDLDDHANYSVHPYIRVEPSTDYTLSSGNIYATPWMAYYNKDKKFLGRRDTALGSDNTLLVTTTADTHYVRFVLSNSNYNKKEKPMFAKGAVKPPYVLGQDLLKNVGFANDVKDTLRDVIKPFKYDLPVGNVFNAPSGYTQYNDVNETMSNADVYAKWDALVAAHPNYISKQFLGLSTDDHEVSCYKLKAQRFENTLSSPVDTGFRDKYPTIFLTCGTHGQEPVSIFTAYAFAHQLCTNWQSDEALELLRYNADILIIPISNPSGRPTRSRKSTSGVDIGRNFPCSTWEQYANVPPEQNTYAGPYPASEPETRYIMQIFEENDIDIYYDFHNFAASETGKDYFVWVLTNGVTQLRMERTSRVLFGRMSRKWHKDFEWVPENWQVGYSQVVTGGLPYNYAAEIAKVPLCGTIEMSLNVPLQTPAGSRFDETHSKMLVEGLVNWLLINLQEINGK